MKNSSEPTGHRTRDQLRHSIPLHWMVPRSYQQKKTLNVARLVKYNVSCVEVEVIYKGAECLFLL